MVRLSHIGVLLSATFWSSPWILLAITAVACQGATTPWALGDEAAFQCYTLSTKEDIATPRGVSVAWEKPPATDMVSTRADEVQFRVTVGDSFWAASSTTTLLGGTYNFNFFRRVCTATTNPNCTASTAGECCVTHANIHSCRSADSFCEPWIKPQNSTDPSATAGHVLVTHTPAQVGGAHTYSSTLHLPEGTWYIIGHFKIMNFQCAVGATRKVRAPPPPPVPSQNAVPVALVAGAGVLLIMLVLVAGFVSSRFLWRFFALRHAPRGANADGSGKAELTAVFVSVANEVALRETSGEGAASVIHKVEERTLAVASDEGCYVARRLESHFLVVTAEPTHALKFVAAMCREFMKVDATRKPRQLWPVIAYGVARGPADVALSMDAKSYFYRGAVVDEAAKMTDRAARRLPRLVTTPTAACLAAPVSDMMCAVISSDIADSIISSRDVSDADELADGQDGPISPAWSPGVPVDHESAEDVNSSFSGRRCSAAAVSVFGGFLKPFSTGSVRRGTVDRSRKQPYAASHLLKCSATVQHTAGQQPFLFVVPREGRLEAALASVGESTRHSRTMHELTGASMCGGAEADNTRLGDDCDDHAAGGVLAALEQASCGLASKFAAVAVVHFRDVDGMSRDERFAFFREASLAAAAISEQHRGFVVTVTGTSIVATFNAAQPVTRAPRRALIFAIALLRELRIQSATRHIRACAAVVAQPTIVGRASESSPLVTAGALCPRGLALAQMCCRLQGEAGAPLVVVAGSAVDDLTSVSTCQVRALDVMAWPSEGRHPQVFVLYSVEVAGNLDVATVVNPLSRRQSAASRWSEADATTGGAQAETCAGLDVGANSAFEAAVLDGQVSGAADDEWMYQLQQGDDDPFRAINDGFRSLALGDLDHEVDKAAEKTRGYERYSAIRREARIVSCPENCEDEGGAKISAVAAFRTNALLLQCTAFGLSPIELNSPQTHFR